MSTHLFGLMQRRERLGLTLRGWLVVFATLGLAVFGGIRGIYPFLAVEDPGSGRGVLVVEGWEPDYALAAALEEFRRHPYDGLFVTGAPMDQGYLSEYPTNAELSAAVLRKMGAELKMLHAVPSQPVRQDRTYAMAIALRTYLASHGFRAERINIISLGPHARRSRLLYEKAFGPQTAVGIVSIPPQDFDPQQWWHSSQGFRIVTGEAIAYFYARFLF